MQTDLTEEQKRKLTEDFLGEKWHWITENPEWKAKWNTQEELPDEYICHCGMSVDKYRFYAHQNRPFTTPDDMMALKEKLVEKGLYKKFTDYGFSKYFQDGHNSAATMHNEPYDQWLINPLRFINLVSGFLENEKREDEIRAVLY